MQKLFLSYSLIDKLKYSATSTENIGKLYADCQAAIDDDLNTPMVIANLFEASKIINSAYDGKLMLTQENINELKNLFDTFLFDILGMKYIPQSNANNGLDNQLMDIIIDLRKQAKFNKDYASADAIRDKLAAIGVEIKDTKDGVVWSVK